MADGIWAAASGAVAQAEMLHVYANNLANLQTTGFKGDLLVMLQKVAPHHPAPEVATSHHVENLESVPDWSQGGIRPSTNPLDMAIDGAGFFTLLTPAGERLSRAGRVKLDVDGMMRSEGGHPFVGIDGPILVPLGADISVDAGGVVFANGTPVDRLRVVDVEDRALLVRSEKGGLWNAEGARAFVIEPDIQPGAIEASNVNAASVMTQMVVTQRAYESFHRCIESINGSEKRLVERVS